MYFNFSQVPPLTTELAPLELQKNQQHHFILVAINLILFKFTGDDNMHNILDEFELSLDRTTDYLLKKFPYTYNGETMSSRFLGC